jgi:hypothetical protein
MDNYNIVYNVYIDSEKVNNNLTNILKYNKILELNRVRNLWPDTLKDKCASWLIKG